MLCMPTEVSDSGRLNMFCYAYSTRSVRGIYCSLIPVHETLLLLVEANELVWTLTHRHVIANAQRIRAFLASL